MKKLLVLWAVILAVQSPIPARAQGPAVESTPYANRARIGFQAGLNISSYSVSDTSARVGWVLGGQLELPLTGVLYIEPGLRLMQKGFKYDNGASGAGKIDFSVSVTTLEFPVLAKVKLLAGAPAMPFFFLGPDLMLKLGSSISANDAAGNPLTVTGTLNSKTFAFGLDFGAGAEFRIGQSDSAFALLRYTLGLTNESEIDADSKYHGIQLIGGMSFGL